MKPKVLIAAPTHAVKNYCIFEYVANVFQMGCDFLLVDNTEDNANKDMYDILGVKWMWCNPKGKDKFQAITDSQNMIRDYFLKGDYTHLFFIETDLFPHPYVKDKLLAYDKLVIGCPYFIFSGDDTRPMIQQMSLHEATLGEFRWLSLQESFLAMDGSVKQVHGMGFGCVMIKREIIEAVEFRCNPDKYTQIQAFADSFFYADLARENIPVFIDTTEMIRHINEDWVKKIDKPQILNN